MHYEISANKCVHGFLQPSCISTPYNVGSVLRRLFRTVGIASLLRRLFSSVGDSISTEEAVQYCGGIASVHMGDSISTMEALLSTAEG